MLMVFDDMVQEEIKREEEWMKNRIAQLVDFSCCENILTEAANCNS